MKTRSRPTQTAQLPPLRAVREAHGLGLNQVARLAHIDPGYLSRAERGLQRLSIPALYRVAQALGLRDLTRRLAPYVQGRGAA